MDEQEMKARTKKFALNALALVEVLPINTQGRAIGGQFVRSATSIGANYRAACRARSKAEFISKLGIAEEEADESAYWLELMGEGKLVTLDMTSLLLREANELVAILTSSRKSASSSPARPDQG